MTQKSGTRTYPFGDLSKDRGRDRLFTIGMCLGFLLGLTVTGMMVKIVLGAIAVMLVIVRTAAQYRYPDRDVPRQAHRPRTPN